MLVSHSGYIYNYIKYDYKLYDELLTSYNLLGLAVTHDETSGVL